MKFVIIKDDGTTSVIESENIYEAIEYSWNPYYGYDHILSITSLGDEEDDR